MTDEQENEWAGPSRSHQRREALDVLKLAKDLSELTEQQLSHLPLSEDIRLQIDECRRITQHIAHKRQLQFLAKTMRKREDELPALREALHLVTEVRRRGSAEHKRLEVWRERLLRDGDVALGEFIARFPMADRQSMRQWLQKARSAKDESAAQSASRHLFRAMREATVASGEPAGSTAEHDDAESAAGDERDS